MFSELRIFTGNAHPELALNITRYLEAPLGECEVFEFSNENIFVRICENVRQRDVFIVQPLASPVNTRLMELLIMIDAFRRASAGRITAVIPYFAYGRSDKKDQPRVPITARLLADLITTAGADRVLTVDLHVPQIQGFFRIPVDELTAFPSLGDYFRDRDHDNLVVVAPDLARAKDARNIAAKLDVPLAIVEKRRTGNVQSAEAIQLIGEVKGRNALIVDDEIDRGSTLTEVVKLLLKKGCGQVLAAAVHGVFSGPAIERLRESPVEEVVITDTLPQPAEKRLDKIRTLSVAPLLGEAIRRIHSGQSVGALFEQV
ncbi:MAG: ribose-phosphate pyrophosphokinase [Dehalococcoidia bacterium]|nr:ribose-phosphate pyrophosphokinase [Dehalococcoidia bacterium]